ncbi:DEAD/DEAH box helicase [Bacillus sp. AFS053548]|uniref:DEAD/DEAH box helicase n=1 Tax=Bacillus sp. AFS053548 TaxID=2033505 RepID=UPI000BFBD1A9|nr:DEAD/DEAH box helicase [Bacillus sp. AFS053548]PGM55865.1 DEAD/DEAH box helicase [Bacillus sp. AFS053548]
MNKFSSLGLSEELTEYLTELGITEPTPIQEKAIPIVFEGKDLIGQAQTGTGKTFAFLFPILERINLELPHTQALVVAPTRELALQITAEAKRIVSDDFGVLAVYGGQDVEQQARKLKSGAHLIIATPGRLLDHLRRGTINLDKVDFLVLDEADQMLHIGFLHEVEDIINQTPVSRQTLLFSATMPDQIQSLAKRYMKKPEIIKVKVKRITLDEIEQLIIETTDRGKLNALLNQIKEAEPFLAIIFCRTKRRANKLNEQLKGKGLLSEELHGDLTQGKREKVMKLFREAKIQYLVATDVAARGIDVEGVTHVFNYDIPLDTESYVHRIGRTGRAGDTGIAITFATPKDFQDMRVIEKELNLSIKRIEMERGESSGRADRTENAGRTERSRNGGRAERSRNAGRAERPGDAGRTDRPGNAGRTDRPGNAGRTERPGNVGRTDRAGNAGRADRTGNVGRAERPGNAGRTERPGNAGRTDRSGNADKADRAGNAGRADRAGNTGRAERPGNAGRADRSGNTGRADRAGNTGRAERPGNAGRADKAGNTGRADRSGNTGRAERPGNAGRADRSGNAGRSERTGNAGRAERIGNAGRAERTGNASRAERPGNAGRADRTRSAGRTTRNEGRSGRRSR